MKAILQKNLSVYICSLLLWNLSRPICLNLCPACIRNIVNSQNFIWQSMFFLFRRDLWRGWLLVGISRCMICQGLTIDFLFQGILSQSLLKGEAWQRNGNFYRNFMSLRHMIPAKFSTVLNRIFDQVFSKVIRSSFLPS